MPDAELPRWLDKTEVSLVGVLTFDDGERMTAEIVEFDEECSELVVEFISTNCPRSDGGQDRLAIPISEIIDFKPQTRTAQTWPYSDPCRGMSFSLARFLLMATVFLCPVLVCIPLFLLLGKTPYGLQAASAIVYTFSAVFLTFAATRKWHRFLFTCPAVRPQIPRLLWRHLGFLVALFVLQTAALVAHPNLPDWWNIQDKRGATPFDLALMFACIGLGCVEVITNRSLLDGAHREFSA